MAAQANGDVNSAASNLLLDSQRLPYFLQDLSNLAQSNEVAWIEICAISAESGVSRAFDRSVNERILFALIQQSEANMLVDIFPYIVTFKDDLVDYSQIRHVQHLATPLTLKAKRDIVDLDWASYAAYCIIVHFNREINLASSPTTNAQRLRKALESDALQALSESWPDVTNSNSITMLALSLDETEAVAFMHFLPEPNINVEEWQNQINIVLNANEEWRIACPASLLDAPLNDAPASLSTVHRILSGRQLNANINDPYNGDMNVPPRQLVQQLYPLIVRGVSQSESEAHTLQMLAALARPHLILRSGHSLQYINTSNQKRVDLNYLRQQEWHFLFNLLSTSLGGFESARSVHAYPVRPELFAGRINNSVINYWTSHDERPASLYEQYSDILFLDRWSHDNSTLFEPDQPAAQYLQAGDDLNHISINFRFHYSTLLQPGASNLELLRAALRQPGLQRLGREFPAIAHAPDQLLSVLAFFKNNKIWIHFRLYSQQLLDQAVEARTLATGGLDALTIWRQIRANQV